MSIPHRTRLVNPWLGTYFGIFASAFIGLFLVLLILEQLDAAPSQLQLAVLLGPVVFFIGIAAAAATNQVGEFFAAGRRVPAVYNGLAFAITAIGGTGFMTLTGLFFHNGFDAWFIAIGIFSGFLVMGIAISPYLRKYGAYTIPTYMARRFESRWLRLLAAMLFSVPLILLLAAELAVAVQIAMSLTGYPRHLLVALMATVLVAIGMLGGMRSVGWVGTAQAMAAIIAVLVIAGMIGVTMTNLPLAQLSYGPVLRHVGRLEEAQQIAAPAQAMFAFTLAGQAPEAIAYRLATPFNGVGAGAFTAGVLTIMMGVAGAPWLLPRCSTTLGVYEARKSLGWAIFFAGVIILTLSAIAVFLRAIVMESLVGRASGQLPEWFTALVARGVASFTDNGAELPLSAFSFARDEMLFAAPKMMSFPESVGYLAFAGAIAAALAAAAATSFALASILAEDVYGGFRYAPSSDANRAHVSRAMCLLVMLLAVVFHLLIRVDPLELFLMALTLSAATAFPVITLSIWWKRLNAMGAAAGMLSGFVMAVLLILASASGAVGITLPLAGVLAALCSACAAGVVSVLTPMPSRSALEAAREMRIPGGETVYDREMRQLRFNERARN